MPNIGNYLKNLITFFPQLIQPKPTHNSGNHCYPLTTDNLETSAKAFASRFLRKNCRITTPMGEGQIKVKSVGITAMNSIVITTDIGDFVAYLGNQWSTFYKGVTISRPDNTYFITFTTY